MQSHVQTPPVFRLSQDILYHIFLTLPEPKPYRAPVPLNPRTLSHVCRLWRAIAMGSPILWSRITFRSPPPFDEQRLWIERSKRVGLHITVLCSFNIKQTVRLIQLLRPYVSRWKSLSFPKEFKAKSYRLFFDELRNERAPLLQTMKVQNVGPHGRWRFWPFRGVAESLSKLQISMCRLDRNAAMFSGLVQLEIFQQDESSWSQLITTLDIFNVLSRASSTLEHLQITVEHCLVYAKPSNLLFPIVLPRLTFCSFPHPEEADQPPLPWVLEIYSGILAPNYTSNEIHPSILHHLISQHVFPFPGLRSLYVKKPSYDVEEVVIQQSTLMGVLALLPQLEKLNFDNINALDHLVIGCLCPRLRELVIHAPFDFGPYRRISGMKDMVKARRALAAHRGGKDTLERIWLERLDIPIAEEVWLRRHGFDMTIKDIQYFDYSCILKWLCPRLRCLHITSTYRRIQLSGFLGDGGVSRSPDSNQYGHF